MPSTRPRLQRHPDQGCYQDLGVELSNQRFRHCQRSRNPMYWIAALPRDHLDPNPYQSSAGRKPMEDRKSTQEAATGRLNSIFEEPVVPRNRERPNRPEQLQLDKPDQRGPLALISN